MFVSVLFNTRNKSGIVVLEFGIVHKGSFACSLWSLILCQLAIFSISIAAPVS